MRWVNWVTAAVVLATAGCATTGGSDCAEAADAPKTLLRWSATKDEESGKENGNGNGNEKAPEEPPEPDEPDEITTDRPDFTEASSTVGRGRIQLEAGYTFVRDRSGGVTTNGHSYPEALFRIGALANWLEFRVGQNFGHTRTGAPHAVFSAGGAEDLYLGVKLGLTEQERVFPEMALILQTTVPTGHRDFSAGKMQPGFNLLYGWDVTDRLSFAGSSQANRAIDAVDHGYIELAQSLTVGYTITPKLGAYTEWFAFFPTGAVAPGVGPQHYLNGGFTYKVTNNFQLDVRAGVGLNRQADDFFTGAGFAYRY